MFRPASGEGSAVRILSFSGRTPTTTAAARRDGAVGGDREGAAAVVTTSNGAVGTADLALEQVRLARKFATNAVRGSS